MPGSELIECGGCGRRFTSENAVDMLAAIKGPCPCCGGRFQLAPLAVAPAAASWPQPRSAY